MFLRCILVPVGPAVDPTRRLDAALRLGQRLQAHLDVRFIAPGAEHVLASMASLVPVDDLTVGAIARSVQEAAAEGKAIVSAWCTREGVRLEAPSERLDTTFAHWSQASGELEPLLALDGRIHDVIVVDRPNPAVPFTERVFDTALFATGRPTLMVGDHVPYNLLSHVVVAWNGSLEATRLVGQSMTLLHEAERVTVLQVDTGKAAEAKPADLSAYLRWHGIVADAVTLPVRQDATVGETILAEAVRREASMLAMGGYTHSRVRQLLLGGATRHIVEHATMPVLMAH